MDRRRVLILGAAALFGCTKESNPVAPVSGPLQLAVAERGFNITQPGTDANRKLLLNIPEAFHEITTDGQGHWSENVVIIADPGVGIGPLFQQTIAGEWKWEGQVGQRKLRIDVKPTEHYVDIVYTCENVGGVALLPSRWVNCAHFLAVPDFYEAGNPGAMLNRTYAVKSASLVSLVTLDRAASWNGQMPHFRVAGNSFPPNIATFIANGYGWGMSSDILDEGYVAIAGEQGGTIAVDFFPPHTVQYNSKLDFHSCIHSNGYMEAIPPGETRTIYGRVIWTTATPADAYSQFRAAGPFLPTVPEPLVGGSPPISPMSLFGAGPPLQV